MSTSPVATQAIDLDRRVVIWNPASERTFGWTAREVIGKPLPAAMTPAVIRPMCVATCASWILPTTSPIAYTFLTLVRS